jgi:hypothetical protein
MVSSRKSVLVEKNDGGAKTSEEDKNGTAAEVFKTQDMAEEKGGIMSLTVE